MNGKIKEINQNLEKTKGAIYEVIVFFDVFSFPLSAYEIWRYLRVECSYAYLLELLSSFDETELSCKEAYYFLPGRSEIINKRKQNIIYAGRKIKRALLVAKIFKYLPWVEMIAVGNIIGSNNLKDASDIDFFIISQKNRVWLLRFVSTLIVKFLGLRPKVNDMKDKICLSFYLDEDDVDLRKFMLKNNDDLYFYYWLADLCPIYSRNEAYEKFISKNDWIKSVLPNWQAMKQSEIRQIKSPFLSFYKEVFDLFFGGLESYIRRFQLFLLPHELRKAMNKGTEVVISETVLKMHVNDRRQDFFKKYINNLRKKHE